MAAPRTLLSAKSVCGTGSSPAPKTPSSTALTEAVSFPPLQITPLESIETERDPNTPHKDPSLKKKSGKLVSKRKLFLQNGESLQINKAKRHAAPKTSTVQAPASRPVEAAPKVHYPLTERQQLQYLLEVTAKEAKQDSGSSSNEDLPFVSNKTKKKDISKDNQIEARIRKRNERGETALHVAAIRGDLEDLVALIKAGAVINAKDNAGWTPLHEACNYGNLRIVQELVWSGADVNSPGYEGITPLHDAVINDHIKVVKFLLDNGADPTLQTSQNYSTMDLARSAAVLNLLSPEQTRDYFTVHTHESRLLQPAQYEPNFNLPTDKVNGLNSSFIQRNALYDDGFERMVHVDVKNQVPQVVSLEGCQDVNMCINPQEDFRVTSGSHRDKQDLQGTVEFSGNSDQFVDDQMEVRGKKEIQEDVSARLLPKQVVEKNDRTNHDDGAWHYYAGSAKMENDGNAEVAAESFSENLFENFTKESMSDIRVAYPNSSEESLATDTLVQINARNLPAKKPDLTVTPENEEDTVIPEKLNECLDKALIEISSYLGTSQNIDVQAPHGERNLHKKGAELSQNDKSFAGNISSTEIANTDTPQRPAPLPLETQLSGDHCREDGQHTNTQSKETEQKMTEKNTFVDDLSNNGSDCFECQPVVNFTKIKPRSEKKKEGGGVERSGRSDRRKRSSTRSSESSKYGSIQSVAKEECASHIPNVSWRSDLSHCRYSLSAVPLCVPGYEDFLINSKNGSKSLSNKVKKDPSTENQLDRLINQHHTEKVKLRMTLEQELVRLFGNFARKKAGYQVPYSACTVITSQMRPLGMKRVSIEREQPVSIKLEVDKILEKFNRLKTEMLRRHNREIEVVIALGNFCTEQGELTGGSRVLVKPRQNNDSPTSYGEDFELLPAKFNEYYEEVLCATD